MENSPNDGLEKVTDTIKSDDLYWESGDDKGDEKPKVGLPSRPSPMKKTITRNVGNTQRRRFR